MDEKKTEIVARAMMNVECRPAIIEKDISMEKYIKLPLSEVSALGVAFEPLAAAFQKVFHGGEVTTGIYRVTVPNGMHLAARANGTGYLGSALSDATNQVAGQATLNPLNSPNPLVFNPTMLFMGVALVHIGKKLDSIQKIQQELLDFLAQKERSVLNGDLKFLADVTNNYKYNWDNDKYKNNNHIKVLDIMHSSEHKIDFYREQIASKLNMKSLFHSDQEVKEQLSGIQSDFRDYQISLYLYSFSSFLQVMLLENFDSAYLDGIVRKVEDYSFEYRELYAKSFVQIEEHANSSIQSNLLKGLASVNKFFGEAISKVPVISNSQVDETLIEMGEKLEELSSSRATQTMQQFIEKQSVYIRPFVENINTVNRLYNQPLELLFDKENIYLEAG